jgi:L-iditol 2-dehydrogenase
MTESGVSRVATLIEPKRIVIEEEPIPGPPAGGIVVRIRAALTDGTDLKTYRRGHPLMPMPTRFGHEFSGDVAAVADGVARMQPGDPVMCTHSAPCGACYWCVRGEEELCETIVSAMLFGAYSDYIAVPQRIVDRNCFLKPADVSYAEGAFLEPLACVAHSLSMLSIPRDSIVAIVGNGAFGMLHTFLLQREGIDALVFGRRAERIALAKELGLQSFDTREKPIRDVIFERTRGRGADAVIECTGTQEMWELSPSLVRRGGVVAFFAGLPADAGVTFDARRLHYDELRLIAPFHFTPDDVRAAFALIASGALPLRRLITHIFALSEIATAFTTLDSGEGMKALIEP